MKGGMRSAFKTPLVRERSLSLHPIAWMILAEAVVWASARSLPVSITETVTTYEEDARLNRISVSHSEGRAFDMSTRGWDEESIALFMKNFETKYGAVAAIGRSGKPSLIVRHDTGSGDHFHVQINSKYALHDILVGSA